MPTAYLTRIVEFTATHRFPDVAEFAGASGDHSHRYRCAVTVKGVFDPRRSGVMSLEALDSLLKREVVERFDGRHINEGVATFANGMWLATGEALALHLWERLLPGLPAGITLDCVRVEEGARLYSEYRGDT